MKRKISITAIIVLVLSMVLCGSFCASASQGDFYGKNIADINERCASLGDIMDGYAAADGSEGKTVAIRTSAVIMGYYNSIGNLRADSRISSIDLSDEIYLLYLKGKTSGECAWVYESHIGSLDAEAREGVCADYEIIIGKIKESSDISVLESEGWKYSAEMSVTVYTAKIEMLCESGDSAEVAIIAAGAISDIKKIADGTLTGITYDEVYRSAERSIALQRLRESAIESFAVSYNAIMGDGAFEANGSSDKNIAAFLYAVKQSEAAADFNNDIEGAILGVLDRLFDKDTGEYTKILKDGLRSGVSAKRVQADAEDRIMRAEALFSDFSLRLSSARAKDSLVEYSVSHGADAAESVDKVLEEYLSEDGIFEACKSSREIELELRKACLRIDWAYYHFECSDKVADILEGLDASSQKIEEIYSLWDSELKDAATLEAAREALRGAMLEADRITVELECEAFETRHKDIIEKSAESVEVSDKADISAAVEGFMGLSSAAQDKLSEAIRDLSLKYRAVCRIEISLLGEGEYLAKLMKSYILLIDSLELTDTAKFILCAENILDMARSAVEICALYESVVSSEYYPRFDERYAALFAEKRDFYLSKIYSADYTSENIEVILVTVRGSASLELCRCECEARIDSIRQEGDSAQVSEIINSSVESLKYADDTESMRGIVAEAEISVYRQRSSEELGKIYLAYRERLTSLGYIGEVSRESYLDRIAEKYESARTEIFAARFNADVDIAYLGGERAFDTLWSEASAENISESVKLHIAKSESVRAEAESNISAMSYLSATEKKRFADSIAERSEKFRMEISTMKDTAQIEKAYLSYTTDTQNISEQVYERNISNAKDYRASESEKLFAELEQMVKGLKYISADKATEFLIMGEDYLNDCLSAIGVARKLADIDAAFGEYSAKIDSLSAEAVASDLDTSRTYYAGEAESLIRGLESKIAEMKYLGDDLRESYEREITELRRTSLEALSGAEDVGRIDSLWADICKRAANIEKSAFSDELSGAKQSAKELIVEKKNSVVSRFTSLGYLSQNEMAALTWKAEECLSSGAVRIEGADNIDRVMQELNDTLTALEEIACEASATDLENARRDIGNRITEKFNSYHPSAYSADKYETIRSAYESAMARVAEADTVNRLVAVMEDAYRDMSAVISIFVKTRGEERRRLKLAYDELVALEARYSAASFAELRDIYERTLRELDATEESRGVERLVELVDTRISQMRNIKTEWVAHGDINSTSSGFSDYPAGYDVAKNGPWALVTGTDGLPSDVKLGAGIKEISKHHKTALKIALKSGAISYVGATPMTDEDIAAVLKGYDIKGVIDLKLIKSGVIYNEFTGLYTVKLLLPVDMRNLSGLKVLYVSGDGSAEYYDASRDGSFLVFETAHFSEFIIVGEKAVNLTPVIVLLSIAAIFEGICAVFVRLLGDRATTTVLSAAFLPISPLSVIIPSGGGVIVAILGALDAVLGVYIGITLFKLIKRKRSSAEQTDDEMMPIIDFGDDSRSEITAREVIDEESIVDDNKTIGDNENFPAVLPALLDSVSAEEADELVSDSNIPSMLVVADGNMGICRGCKKTFINVDTISDNFLAGDSVSLKELKEKGLIPQSACFLKVLARGVINKPLTVRAQSFSANSIKMISLTGGTAILEGNPDGK